MAEDYIFWILSSIGGVFIVFAVIRLLLKQTATKTFSIMFIVGEMFILPYFIKQLIDEASVTNIFTSIVILLTIIISITACSMMKKIKDSDININQKRA